VVTDAATFLLLLSCTDSTAYCYEALKSKEKFSDIISICNRDEDSLSTILLNGFLDGLDVPPDDGPLETRLAAFQNCSRETTAPLHCSSRSMLKKLKFVMLNPTFRLGGDTTSTIVSTPSSVELPANAREDVVILHIVLQEMSQFCNWESHDGRRICIGSRQDFGLQP